MSKDGATGIDSDRVSQLVCAECQKELDVSHLPSFSEIKCPECGTRQIVPAKFGSFLLVTKLGSGGMGVIYHAMDKELGRHVALKVMKKSLGENQEFVQSFKHEAQAAAALNHRNVVQIYSFGQFRGQPYIVMELVAGGRLDEMIAGGKQMDETRALAIHIEVAEGMRAASDLGLIHSDIKPANILFGQDGEAKVVDFGLASFVGQQQQQSGQIWGTPYYIAPEKARGKKVDFRSDIYSLGATLFHVLAGKPPFDGPTPTDVVLARLHNPVPSLHDVRPDMHPETVALVTRMLAVDPSMRYPSYPALLLDMRAAQKAARVTIKRTKSYKTLTSAVKPVSGIKPIRRDFRKILKVAGLALAAVVVVAGAAGGWIVHQKKQAHLAAEQAAQERRTAALEQGERAWNRVTMLVEHISSNVDTVAPMEQQVFDWAADIGERSQAPTQAIIEIDRFNEYFNEAEDIFAMSWLIRQQLREDAAGETVEETATRLESMADRLAVLYQEIDGIFEAAQKRFKEAETAYGRVLTARRDSQRRAAEAAARRREEAEARKRAEEEARLAEERRPLVLQQEFDLVDRSRGDNVPLMAQWRFKDAMAALRAVQPQLTQPETQEYCANVLEAYARIEQLRQFLIKTITAKPYPGGWSTGAGARDIVGADEEGLSVSLGAAGAIQIKWEQVKIPQLINMLVYYLRNVNLANPQRAELILAAALLCYESGLFKPAETLIAESLKIHPELSALSDRLMPEMAGR